MKQGFKAALRAVVMSAALSGPSFAQGHFSGLARVEDAGTRLHVTNDVLTFDLSLSQPVPWRLRYLSDPPRMVVDFREVDFRNLRVESLLASAGSSVTALRAGAVADGWSRLVITLDRARLAKIAEMRTGQGDGTRALVRFELPAAHEVDFAYEAARPDSPGWALPVPRDLPPPRPPRGQRPLVVMLDPGHGGIDPGAERDGHSEARLMLLFAMEMKEALIRAGVGEVRLTRDRDQFVPLETRIALAHAAGADVFVSLHADAIPEGVARGATVYTLAEDATDAASAALAERHDRDALMSGVDLRGQDDVIAGVLMNMARVETAPRSARLSAALVGALEGAGLPLHRTPERGAAFSVLKAPDIPSVLVEVGYLSSPGDLARLNSPDWRAQMIGALVKGLGTWAIQDAAESAILRQ